MAILIKPVTTVNGLDNSFKLKEYSIDIDITVGGNNLLIFNFNVLNKTSTDKVAISPFIITLKENKGKLDFSINSKNLKINTIVVGKNEISSTEHLIHMALVKMIDRLNDSPATHTVVDNSILLIKSILPKLNTESVGNKTKGLSNVVIPLNMTEVMKEWSQLTLTNPSTKTLVDILTLEYNLQQSTDQPIDEVIETVMADDLTKSEMIEAKV